MSYFIVTPQPVEKERQASRPTSPVTPIQSDFISGSTVLASALQKKMSRKRKGTFTESETNCVTVIGFKIGLTYLNETS